MHFFCSVLAVMKNKILRIIKNTKLTLLISLCLSLSLNSVAEPLRCTALFLETASILSPEATDSLARDLIHSESSQYQAWSEQLVIKVMQGSIRKKLLATCAEAQGCREKDIARIVTSSIENSFKKFSEYKMHAKKIRGYAILVGLSVGIAISSQYVKGSLPAHVQWLTDFVTIASSIGLYKVGAPLWDYIAGITSRGAFRVKDGKSFFRDSEEIARYETHYRLLQEKMTPREQQQTARFSSLLNTVESTFSAALEAIQSKDASKGGIERASARIANAAIKARKFFPEVTADDLDLVRTVQMAFTQFLPNDGTREKLFTLIIQQIEKYDEAFKDAETASIYRQTIRLWVGLNN